MRGALVVLDVAPESGAPPSDEQRRAMLETTIPIDAAPEAARCERNGRQSHWRFKPFDDGARKGGVLTALARLMRSDPPARVTVSLPPWRPDSMPHGRAVKDKRMGRLSRSITMVAKGFWRKPRKAMQHSIASEAAQFLDSGSFRYQQQNPAQTLFRLGNVGSIH
jgi:hypothetical protein